MDVTRLLGDWLDGDPAAFEAAAPIVYRELRRLAAASLRRDVGARTLQPTALVHEAYIQLAQSGDVRFADRYHFFAIASRLMRQILVQHARKRHAAKRGNGVRMVTLTADLMGAAPEHADVLAVEEAMQSLAAADPRKARVAELRFFAGLKQEEIAEALQVSLSTVERDLRLVQAWFARELSRRA